MVDIAYCFDPKITRSSRGLQVGARLWFFAFAYEHIVHALLYVISNLLYSVSYHAIFVFCLLTGDFRSVSLPKMPSPGFVTVHFLPFSPCKQIYLHPDSMLAIGVFSVVSPVLRALHLPCFYPNLARSQDLLLFVPYSCSVLWPNCYMYLSRISGRASTFMTMRPWDPEQAV
jgi:hypothetical protein